MHISELLIIFKDTNFCRVSNFGTVLTCQKASFSWKFITAVSDNLFHASKQLKNSKVSRFWISKHFSSSIIENETFGAANSRDFL